MKRIAIITAATCIALAGCSKDGPDDRQFAGPMTFRAAVGDRPDGFTRATTDNTWSGGEETAVEVRGEVRKYVADAGGTLTAAQDATPFYWQGPREQVRAWHFGSYLSAEPDEITVRADQSGAGYGASDFLFASGEVELSNPTLVFAHKTAKITMNVRADGRTVASARLGDGNLALTGVWNATAETIEEARGGDGTVTPLAGTPAQGFDAAYSALLIPQDMTGKAFIRVTVDGLEYTYAPGAGEAVLEGGKHYTYNVTVRNGITVEPVGAGDWNDGGSADVGSRTDYTADVLKAGDYVYSDGTWSDGGLRTRYPDGRLVWAETKPSPTAGKKVIGIVFQTDPSRISVKEKELFAANGKTLHGVAMSVKSAGNNATYRWYYNSSLPSPDAYTRDESIEDPNYPGYYLPNIFDEDYKKCYALADADINGYFNTEVIKVRRAADLAAGLYPAFKAAADFSAEAGGPEPGVFTSGWYLPSNGQWFDFLRNIAGAKLGADNLNDWGDGDLFWENNGDVPALLNAAMAAIADGDKTAYISDYDWFWTSSAASPSWARYVYIVDVGDVLCLWRHKNGSYRVRCAFAF